MLKIVHEGHMGIERCKNSIRDLIFRPNINSDIKNIVENCKVCMKYRNNNSKEPLIPHDITQIPWFKLGTDLFHFDNKIYLLVVDYYSKFKEIAHSTSGFTSTSVIQHLKSMFARFGIPFSIVSDNGPPFSSLEFKQFMSEWDIEHITSSPHYYQSNGLAERSIQSIKKLLKKFKKSNLCSPSQLLMSKSIRTKLPVPIDNLKPKLTELIGEKVVFKLVPNGPWINGKVIQIDKYPRSYVIEGEKGGNYRRNRKHLITCASTTSRKNNYEQPNLNLNIDKKSTRSGRTIIKPKRLDL
ncbi:unnamed protein product [Macrosiphum euphorbiae]|uniref:RNA-directed DNA polymerase n=1 Tax=Macrosiphum euphorbiae TaxID=13131 RepID=A0AAV0XNG0_9HEMI|nr:unnamed protein product [Macrosiphum euphorbiae]